MKKGRQIRTPHIELLHADCRDAIRAMKDASFDAVVTDPPYELDLNRTAWDRRRVAFSVALWREVFRVLRPGGHLLAFGGTRTYYRLATAIEDAGFTIRDSIMWIHSEGFPKSYDIGKAIDRRAGAERPVIGARTARDTSRTMLYERTKTRDIVIP